MHLLLEQGADTNAPTSCGETPFYIACSSGLTAIVQRMLECGAKVNVSTKSPLNVACRNKHVAVVELLLSERADPNLPEKTRRGTMFPLHIAAADNNVELVNLLLNHGANVNAVDALGNTALHHIICDDSRNYAFSHSTVDTLLCAGADVNISNRSGETSLYLAVKNELVIFVEDMLSHGGNPNVHHSYKYPLCAACERQNLTLAVMLLKAGADPNLDTGSEVVTRCELPLSIAAKNCNYELVRLLLNCGANPNATNTWGNTPLCVACDMQKLTLVAMFLNAGADPNLTTAELPLSIAAKHGNYELVALLLNAGANPNATTMCRYPLCVACEMQN